MKKLRLFICASLCVLLLSANIASAFEVCCCAKIDQTSESSSEMPCHTPSDDEDQDNSNQQCNCEHGVNSSISAQINIQTYAIINDIKYIVTHTTRYTLPPENSTPPPNLSS